MGGEWLAIPSFERERERAMTELRIRANLHTIHQDRIAFDLGADEKADSPIISICVFTMNEKV